MGSALARSEHQKDRHRRGSEFAWIGCGDIDLQNSWVGEAMGNTALSFGRPHQAHRSRTRRRPRPREGLLLGIRAGIVSVCPFRIAPRVCVVGDAFRARPRPLPYPGLKPG